MKKLSLTIICFLIICYSNISFLHPSSAFSQEHDMDNTSCGMDEVTGGIENTSAILGGVYKPERSDLGGAPANLDYFPIMIVFIQFKNEQNYPVQDWPAGQPPTYMNNLITPFRQSGANWWDSYNGYEVSDIWHEFSRGKLHVLGKAYSVILPHTENEYRAMPSTAAKIRRDVYENLKTQIGDQEWQFFDKWKALANNSFEWNTDGKIDMMYLVFRTSQKGTFHAGANYEGWGGLGTAEGETSNGYLMYSSGSYNLYVDKYFDKDGSGLSVSGRGSACRRELFLEVMIHEHMHFFMGSVDHDTYGKMAYGPGREFSFSPWEMIKLNYIVPKIVTYSNPINILGDYSSRNGTAGTIGEILQIPGNNNEMFLIANRRKISEWDRRMSGDTLADYEKNYLNPNVNPEYGKGIYIYHIQDGLEYGLYNKMDMECADGLWNWEAVGHSSPSWDQNTLHPVFKRTTPTYDNDFGASCSGKDGMSVLCQGTSYDPIAMQWTTNYSQSWYNIGKSHTYTPSYQCGTDRLYTNDENFYYSLEFFGDRWDAWNVGYNEIFSPWSSPNTKDENNNQTGIYVWYKSLNSSTNEATLEIYKVGQNGETETSILQKTPPSRPMGIKVIEYNNGTDCFAKLTWNHNMEPDMRVLLSSKESSPYQKRYKIYRATYPTMYGTNFIYSEIADVYINENTTPEYIDYDTKLYYCSLGGEQSGYHPYPVRYKIKAVDEYEDESVFSDFASTIGSEENGSPIDPDRPMSEENDLPTKYSLYQNYPNPFNPSTNIQFDLPNDATVSLKIYDMLGREVATLVNEFRNAGRYIIGFDGSKLSSGVYYYKIKAGNFEQTRRMVLVK